MKAASGLAVGRQPAPELAGEAVARALAQAGLQQADGVLLFLAGDFARQAQPAVLAAARAAGCLAVGGCTASGVMTEAGWQQDQPAAAALVYAAPAAASPGDGLRLAFTGQRHLPADWPRDPPPAGLLDGDAATWSHGRVAGHGGSIFSLPGIAARPVFSSGLRLLGEPLRAERSQGFELQRVGALTARDSLLRSLPAELRDATPWHRLAVVRQPDEPAIGIVSANPDGSLLLAEPLETGSAFRWAVRQPLAAMQQMRAGMADAAASGRQPDFALLFSCIGRGPLFYGDDDHDLLAFREAFPGVPLLGAYGGGQIVPLPGGSRLFHNSALTLLCESSHV